MSMNPAAFSRRSRSMAGFSLVEVMVGMVIALIGIVMMFQVMENAENRKRTTAAGGDAQISGSIAMYNLERDLRLGGYGFGGSTSMGCTVSAYDTARAPQAFTFQMVPVQIVDGASGAPDQVISLYGGSQLVPVSQNYDTSSASSKRMASTSSRGGLLRGDVAFIVSGTTCGMVEITDNTNTDQRTINHASGAYTDSQNAAATARFNNPTGFTAAAGQIYNLGNHTLPRRNIWQISNNRMLTVTDSLHSTAAADIGEGIVNLQAEYGIDCGATPPNPCPGPYGARDYVVDRWQAAAPTDWTRVIAVRVGLLARSQQYEKTNVTTAAPAWAGGNFTMTNVDGTADNSPDNPNDWRHYRYRVYETTIPLRNLIWGTAP
jgi:type IV pilus assembly protein PilW